MLEYSDADFRLYYIDSSGNISTNVHERFPSANFSYGYHEIYVYSETEIDTPVFVMETTLKTAVIDDTDPRNIGITSDKNGRIYGIAAEDPCIVNVISSGGKIKSRLNIGAEITALFTSRQNGRVYALSKNGITDIDASTTTSCDIPCAPLRLNENYCTDANANVYLFDEMNGFRLALSTDYECLTVMQGIVYAKDGNEILQIDNSGKIKAKYDCGFDADDIVASGSNLAVLRNGNITLLHQSDFIAVENSIQTDTGISSAIKSSKEQTSVKSAETTSSSQNTNVHVPQETNLISEKNDITSDHYIIENGIISNIEANTSIAEFKRNIDYGDRKVSFFNHNGKPVTTGTVGTGWMAVFDNSQTFEIAVTGDVTGEGHSNSRDSSAMAKYLIGSYPFNELHLVAADMDHNHIINSSDLYLLFKSI